MEVWPNMQVAPCRLRQRRAEGPYMWTVRLQGMPADRADRADHVLVPDEHGLFEVLEHG
jgi:hypothetical protein